MRLGAIVFTFGQGIDRFFISYQLFRGIEERNKFGILGVQNGCGVTIPRLNPMLNAIHFNNAVVRTPYRVLHTLPPFPPIVADLLRILNTDDFQTYRLVNLIRTDTAFTKELLRMAKSVGVGLQRDISDLRHVVAILGQETLKSFVVALNLRIYLGTVVRHETLARVWRHSLATATFSDLLYSASPGCFPGPWEETAFVAGLLHKVGALALMVADPSKYAEVIAIAAEERSDLRNVERRLFEIDHCQAGHWTALRWRFSPTIARLALDHHDPSRVEFNLPDLVKIAGLLADSLGYEIVPNSTVRTTTEVRDLLPPMVQRKFSRTDQQLRLTAEERMRALHEDNSVGEPVKIAGWK